MNGVLTTPPVCRYKNSRPCRRTLQPQPLPKWAQFVAVLLIILQFCSQITSGIAANNRTSKAVATTSGTVTTGYTYNNLNQLIEYDSGSGTRTVNLTYDANGNRATRVVTNGSDNGTDYYYYDDENRLIEFDSGTANPGYWYDYAYDYRNRRIVRDESNGGGTLTNLVFSGGTSVQEYDSGNSSPTVENLRGSDYGGGVGGILYTMRNVSGTLVPSYNHYNTRGDVISTTDSSGALAYQTYYEAFGGRVIELAPGSFPKERQRANTKDEDPTGLLDEGFRYRDLTTGSFITRDPAGFIDGPNLYTYVRQNPWTKFDPEGLAEQDQSLDDTRKNGVTIQNVQRTKFKEGEAEGVLEEHGQHVTKPDEISDDRVKELRSEDQYKDKSDDEIRVSESARVNHVDARWALLKYEGSPATKKLFAEWAGMNEILLTTTMAMPGPRGIGMGATEEVGQVAAAGVKFEGLTAEQKLLVQQAMRKAGITDTNLLIKGADMPQGYSGMTLGDEGFVINRSAIKDAKELLETVKHEYQHIVDRRALGDPAAYGQDLEDRANAAEKQ